MTKSGNNNINILLKRGWQVLKPTTHIEIKMKRSENLKDSVQSIYLHSIQPEV